MYSLQESNTVYTSISMTVILQALGIPQCVKQPHYLNLYLDDLMMTR